MRSLKLVMGLVPLVAGAAGGQAAAPQYPRIAPSTLATVAVHVSAWRVVRPQLIAGPFRRRRSHCQR